MPVAAAAAIFLLGLFDLPDGGSVAARQAYVQTHQVAPQQAERPHTTKPEK